jgi:hypothetical protein
MDNLLFESPLRKSASATLRLLAGTRLRKSISKLIVNAKAARGHSTASDADKVHG